EIDVEGTAGEFGEAIVDAGLRGVGGGDAQDRGPIDSGNAGLGVLRGDGDAEETVASSEIEDMEGASLSSKCKRGERTGNRRHHRSHALGEQHPERVFR